MRTRRLFTLLSVTIFLLCSTSPGNEIRFTDEDNGETEALAVGDVLVITLDGNPTTGYQWQVADYDDAVLEQKGEPTYTRHGAAIGGGGSYDFRFEAAGKGETDLRLIYFRPFENKPPIKTFTMTISVE